MQPDLFDTPSAPHQRRSATSKAGAVFVQPRVGSQIDKILKALNDGPLTLPQLADRCGLRLSSVCGRIGWLRQQGQVEKCGTQIGPCGISNTLYRRCE